MNFKLAKYIRDPMDCKLCRIEHGIPKWHYGPDKNADCGRCISESVFKKVSSRPAQQPDAPKFNSTDLILLAHDEWKRREERKHNHPENHWCSGFINGFMTDKKWARELLDKMQKDADNKLRQQHGGDKLAEEAMTDKFYINAGD